MHSVALTEEGTVYTTGVNDEAALGRKTGAAVLLPSPHFKTHRIQVRICSMYSNPAHSRILLLKLSSLRS